MPPVVIQPTTVAVDSDLFNWTTPAAPSNAVTDNTRNGNMAFRFIGHNGHTQTVLAAVGSTLLHSITAFAPLIDNDLLIVNTSRVGFLGRDFGQTSALLNNERISVRPDGLGNTMVGCAGARFGLAQTAVFLSHNLRPVTLEHALANGLADQTFDAIDCFHASMNQGSAQTGGHTEWVRFNTGGSLDTGNDADARLPIPAEALTRVQVDAMLSPAGLSLPAENTVDRAQIYELVIGGQRMFFILNHASEGGGMQQYVMLLIPR